MKERFHELSSYLLDNAFFLVQAVEMMEKNLIELALARTNGNQSQPVKCWASTATP